MQVLLSAPRAGSSYAYESIHTYNLTLPTVKYIGIEEFLDPTKTLMTLEQKIKFLEDKKLDGVDYTFKHHINYLGDYYNTWFKNFYKDDKIVILKRRDTWKWFLSFLFQDSTNWTTAAVMKADGMPNQLNIITRTNHDYNKSLEQFFTIKEQLDSAVGSVHYYEDLDTVSKKYYKLSDFIDYEKYFDDIEDIKIVFNKWKQNYE